jgi:SEC-C motif
MDRRAPAGPDAARLIADPPAEDYALLELSLGWSGLDATQERVAAALRLFVITRDPLDWIPRRGHAWATANGNGDVIELPVYVALDAVRDAIAEAQDLGPVGRYGEAAVRAGAASEHLLVSGAHPGLAIAGRTPRLLEGLDDGGTFPSPAVTVASEGWEPLGLGAIQDLVQEAFGPVDLDRSLVRLDPVEPHEPGCAACRGEGFGFPAELDEARPLMCSPHRAAALAVTAARIMRAQESNPAGWRAIGKASARISGEPDPSGVPMPPRSERPPGRNDPCPCGSGRKYKRCCGA